MNRDDNETTGRPWIWIILGSILLLSMMVATIVIAERNPQKEVPLDPPVKPAAGAQTGTVGPLKALRSQKGTEGTEGTEERFCALVPNLLIGNALVFETPFREPWLTGQRFGGFSTYSRSLTPIRSESEIRRQAAFPIRDWERVRARLLFLLLSL